MLCTCSFDPYTTLPPASWLYAKLRVEVLVCLCLTSSVSTVSSLLLTGCPAPGRRAPIGMFKLA